MSRPRQHRLKLKAERNDPRIRVIDLFAGPGGLGEGFAALNQGTTFKIHLSIEKDMHAHQTLLLRAFFRQFPWRGAPPAYYQYLAGKKGVTREELFERHPREAEAAAKEAWKATLGEEAPALVRDRIESALRGAEDRWILIGGPPCQAYSLVGRSRIVGEKGRSEYERDHRHFLYLEYLRIINNHRPPVFVMENVKGLLSARVGRQKTFERILADLKDPPAALSRHGNLKYSLIPLTTPAEGDLSDFDPTEFIIRAEKFGIPQARHRVIILGIRDDLARRMRPAQLSESPPVPAGLVLHDLPALRSGLSDHADSALAWREVISSIANATWLTNSKVDARVRKRIANIGRAARKDLDRGADHLHRRRHKTHKDLPDDLAKWLTDTRLRVVCNHASRTHMESDLHRYMFVSAYGEVHHRSPLLEDFPRGLLPKHRNVPEALRTSKFNDRFRVQLADRPSTTITSHISKDGHYFIHHDPSQCRSLTVREAARLQTFPDNYFFEGPRTDQYHQVGNAVPPFLARKIAAIVATLFD